MKSLILFLLLSAPLLLAADDSVPVVPTDDGHAVKKLLYVRPFTVTKPHTFHYVKEKPRITQGLIVVVEVEKEFARPRQVNVPVIYVGDKPAERTNVGYESGKMILIVAGDVDLKKTPIYFGSVELPERVDAARGKAELEAARELGVKPFPAAAVDQARARGGEPLAAADSSRLYYALADLVMTYSPTESDLADAYRLLPD